ncbi:SDR family oxidoreductase [Actinomadura sp. KC06]|uniref:SDR family NAD(P)-dependent oxidoreductase n=1 Tax=Actinomadura sp. KC06 TaxID=2530369 RepID=UPI0010520948|nr:glucose 1-dehydrogenase [Actinomadura sp. KC06]TDD33891.1 SDR family oxidoreductase [Actinomadura sp. KC06]
MTEFDGRTILITGGGSGIGLATAERLLNSGANVVLAGRNDLRLKTAAAELDNGDRVLAAPADVSDTRDLDGLAEQIKARFGRLDGVFANAGIGVNAPAAQLAEADFDSVVSTNLKGVYFTVQKALPLLNDGGAIVLNSSWTAHAGVPGSSVYAATKAAVLHLTRTLATETAGRGIRVNAVTPGHVLTDMFNAITGSDEVREMFRAQVALGRLGLPEDIANAVHFLLSDRASYITGQELVVDGGLTKAMPS